MESVKPQESLNIKLINETKSSMQEVIDSLNSQKAGTSWADKTNLLVVAYVEKLTEVYGDVWYKGFLPKEYFEQILLPQHRHAEKNSTGIEPIFPLDTPIVQAKESYQTTHTHESETCLKLVNELKEKIKGDGFTQSVSLAVINGTLKHVDGLHRMIAQSLLLDEGSEYKPIPVFLCDSSKK